MNTDNAVTITITTRVEGTTLVMSLKAADKAIVLAKMNEGTKVEVVYVVDSKTSKSDALRQLDAYGVAEKREERLKDTVE